jgi:hypothetical protein
VRQAVDPSVRPYANFVNHENFLAAVAQRRHLIFDGSGRDPLNVPTPWLQPFTPPFTPLPILPLIPTP